MVAWILARLRMIEASCTRRSTSRPVIAATFVDIEAPECLPERVSLPEHDRPAQPDLEHSQGERLEHRRLVVCAGAPDLVVIAAERGVARAGPGAPWLAVVPDNHVAVHPAAGRDCHGAATRGIARSGHLVIARESGELHARVDSELREHMPEMAVHGVRRDEEALGDLAVRQPFGDEPRDGELGRRQRRPAVRLGFGGDEAASNAELAQAAADAAGVPGRSELRVEREGAAEERRWRRRGRSR